MAACVVCALVLSTPAMPRSTLRTRSLPRPTKRSVALPFLDAPAALDGRSFVGDAGFDPLNLATEESLPRLREAETRHARAAMVACWGWPIAEGGFWAAQKLVPVDSVCTGTDGCYIDQTAEGREAALQLADIGVISLCYWGVILALVIAGELRARALEGTSQPAFDPLRLWSDADSEKRRRLELAEIKHGRLAMVAVAYYWGLKLLATAGGSGAAALAVGVPRGSLTFAHQLWGETCVYSLTRGLSKATAVCLPQETNDAFEFVLSWEILFRTLTGYFREPYF
jgi:hypothetical protein